MAPLSLELCSNMGWIKIGEVKPKESGSISDNKTDGNREIYIFECLSDDSKSIIYHSRAGLDTEIGPMRLLTSININVVKELRKGDKPYEMIIKTDKSSDSRKIRFTHI